MSSYIISKKCDKCGKRKPTKVILEEGTGRNFSKCYFAKCVCDECEVVE